MDERESLDAFGRVVTTSLRDAGIKDGDSLLAGKWRAPSLQKLQAALAEFTPEQRDVVRRVVVEVMTAATHDFLFALQEACDSEQMRILVKDADIAKRSDGFHGEIFGEKGWFARFSAYGAPPEEA